MLQPRSLLRFPGRLSTWLSLIVLATVAPFTSRATPALRAPVPAAASQAESLPPYFYGSSAIPPGSSSTTVASRFVNGQSRIFLTADTTSWPGSDVALAGLKVLHHVNGSFTVATLDGSAAPSSAISGLPFNYVVFNTTSLGSTIIGSATIPAGQHVTQLNVLQVAWTSVFLLTVDVNGNSTPVPGVKINDHGAGFFSVATLDTRNVPFDLTFNYYINLSIDCYNACRGQIPAGVPHVGVSTAAVASPSAVFLTPDASTIPGADVILPGIKVNNHGSAFFTVTTDRLVAAPASGIPFDYVIIQPPPQWEELGPTGRSGKTWTVAVDPVDRLTQYVGSSFGGVWKTTNGGNSWFSAWQGQRQALVMRLAWSPGSRTTLFALGYDGTVYRTDDAANSWRALAGDGAFAPGTQGYPVTSGALAISTTGQIFVCSEAGLRTLASSVATTWQPFEPPGGPHPCSDMLIAPTGYIYAGFRDLGVQTWDLVNGWRAIKNPPMPNPAPGKPVRIAVGKSNIVLNYDCQIYTNKLANLYRTGSEASWVARGQQCALSTPGTQLGYAMAAAIAPDDTHFVVTANDAYYGTLNGDGSASFVHVGVGQDDHQVVYFDSLNVFMSTDNGPRMSRDGGQTWREAETASLVTDGPPIKEYYDLSVSQPDQFGRVLAAGNAQDSGGVGMLGRTSGFGCCGGETGLAAITYRPINRLNSTTGARSSSFRVYGTDGGNPALYVCTFDVAGPAYPTPPGAEEGYYPVPSDATTPECGTQAGAVLAGSPTALAVSPLRRDHVLVGIDTGADQGYLYRSVEGSDGKRFELIQGPSHDSISAIFFNGNEDYAFVGHSSGSIDRIQLPFGAASAIVSTAPSTAGKVVGFTSRPGFGEVYVAYDKSLWRSDTNGVAWTSITSSALQGNLNTGVEIVGITRDPNNPKLYVATGHGNWYGSFGGTPSVWAAPTPAGALSSWSELRQGLPDGIPITGIGMAANQGLYLATQGRGIWWRRDVAVATPNSGVNLPDHGVGSADVPQRFVTTCSYPGGWHGIHTLDLKFALGLGPGDSEPVALWVEFDQDANLIRFYDPDSGTWSAGAPGSNAVLSSRFAEVRLAGTTVHGFGPTDPTVAITWDVVFHAPAQGAELQQYLKVADDAGSITAWDKVGSWQVGQPTWLPLVRH